MNQISNGWCCLREQLAFLNQVLEEGEAQKSLKLLMHKQLEQIKREFVSAHQHRLEYRNKCLFSKNPVELDVLAHTKKYSV